VKEVKNRILLDCTLRDGGYVNDWEFGHDKITEIFKRQVSSGVEMIQVGFLDDRRKFDMNRTIMPDTESANKVFAGLDKGNAIVEAMIDYGTCSLDNIGPHTDDSFIDCIKVIFKEHLMEEALQYCKAIQDKGYKVFANMVNVTTYSDASLKKYAKLVNKVHPFGNSMVDTYGLMHKDQMLHIFQVLDKYIDQDIMMGFHSHNNFQLAYANSVEYLNTDTKRTIVADGTLYGMGKSAGNAPVELLAMYMNEHYGKHYDISQMLEAIDNSIMEIYQKQYWGYSMKFYIASAHKVHPNYVSYLLNKKTLSVKQITEILDSITPEKKMMYDAKHIEQLYVDYQSMECDDKDTVKELKKALKGRDVLLLGPGSSMQRQKGAVNKFIGSKKPVIIAVNYAPKDIKIDYVFVTKSKRYTQLFSDLQEGINRDAIIIATSNVTKTEGQFKYVFNYSTLIDIKAEIIDNSLVMLLKAMIKLGVKDVNLAGFDGYSKKNDNYFNISREYSFAKEKAAYLNGYVREFLASVKKKINVNFVTKSYYNKK